MIYFIFWFLINAIYLLTNYLVFLYFVVYNFIYFHRKEGELDLVRSPPMSPSRTGSIKTSVVLKANKQRIRDLQNEL